MENRGNKTLESKSEHKRQSSVSDALTTTAEETKCIQEVRSKLPDPLDTDDKCDDHTILRFLRARELKVDDTIQMMVNWRKWRDEHDVDNLTAESVKNEVLLNTTHHTFYCACSPAYVLLSVKVLSGKAYFHGFDKAGRACCIVRPRLHDPSKRDLDEVMRFAVYRLEEGIKLSESKGESDQICLLYDRKGFSYGQNFDRKLFGTAHW